MNRMCLACLLAITFLHAATLADGIPLTHTRALPTHPIPRPAYLHPTQDKTFNSTVVRITGDPGEIIPGLDARWSDVARHTYSKISAWNCDQSLIFLGLNHGFPSTLFLDGATYRPKFGRNKLPGTEVRWHATQAEIMVFVNNNRIGFWNVVKDTTETVAEFPEYSNIQIGPWEGNLSHDGKRIAVLAQRNKQRVAFVYNFERQHKHTDIVFGDDHLDWVSVSASGRYVIANGTFFKQTPAGRLGGPDRTRVFDLDGKPIGTWIEPGRPSHYGLTMDGQGDDVAVGVSNSGRDEGRVIKRRLRDGRITVLTPAGYAGHTSARNINRPGWVYTTYQHINKAWPPYHDEVVAIKLDGSQTVERIARLHAPKGDYLAQAQAVPSPDGQRVLWASSWYGKGNRPVGAYVARRAQHK